MRAFLSASLGALTLAACAGGAHHAAHGPAGIPYLCGDDRVPARIVYEGGGYYPRGTAELHYDGRTVHLTAMPPAYGLRYEGSGLAWTARGEAARLSELAADHSEREIATCRRVHEPGMPEARGGVEAAEAGDHH